MTLTTLAALLLFLGEGKSGYDIRLLFQATPLGLFSDSPGAIYPALARLERGGLLAGEKVPSARRRRVFRRTPAGEAALLDWLKAPIASETAERRPHEIELRYVLIAYRLGRAEADRFLDEAAQAFRRRLAALEAFRDANGAMGAPSLDALDLGIRLFGARLQWCRDTTRKGEKE
ncbi:MAG: Transcriptional regulator, PadR family [Alphaproteobacteria bacterium]|nr:Transcriptional regulator, PadR family [Alphaproteobacteria bacterium]